MKIKNIQYKLLLLAFILAISLPGSAQINGRVTDGITGKPMPNANVFISSTSRGTVSDNEGYFELLAIPPGKYDLVISMVGYETIVHSFNTTQLPLKLKVQLEKKVLQEEVVTVTPFEKNGWERWGLLFTQTFIGESLNASRCKILNKEVIRFRFHKKENLLEAVADDILMIENKALGYRVKYQLEGFTYNTASRSVVYLGYPLFEEMENGRQAKYYKNRKKAYYGSIMHLMRCFYNNNLFAEGFEVRPLKKEFNAEKQRVKEIWAKNMVGDSAKAKQSGQPRVIHINGGHITAAGGDSSAYYSRILRQPDYFEAIGDPLLNTGSLVTPAIDPRYKILSFENYLLVFYKNEPESAEFVRATSFGRASTWQTTRLFFINDARQVEIEANGNYFNPIDLFTEGYMGWEKMGDMLPLDYAPPAND